MNPEALGLRLIEDLEMTAAVDPDAFRKVCDELEVWEYYDESCRLERIHEVFGFAGTSAWRRFVGLSACLDDGTLAEFLFSTDDGQEAIPDAVIEAAAVGPFDPQTHLLDRPAWRREIARRLGPCSSKDGSGCSLGGEGSSSRFARPARNLRK